MADVTVSFIAKRQVFDDLDLKPIEVCKCHRERLNNYVGHHCKDPYRIMDRMLISA